MSIFKGLVGIFKNPPQQEVVKPQSDVSKLADQVYKTYREKWKRDRLVKFAAQQKELDIWDLDRK